MQIKKIFVWGTGAWAKKLLSALPNDYQIEAFIETNPSKATFQGKNVLSADDCKNFYKQTDYVFVAVANSEDIKNFIWKNFHSFDKFQFMVSDDPIEFTSYYEKSFSFGKIERPAILPQYTICDVQGLSFVVNTKSHIFINALSNGKTYQEEDIYSFFAMSDKYYGNPKYIGGGGIFLDIGANIGTTSIYVKKKINPELIVHAFEPVKDNCKMLKASLLLNDISDEEYKLVQTALSNENGNALVMVSDNNIGNNVVVKGNNYNSGFMTESISTIKLDDYLEKNNIYGDMVKYIWMDVQGHEAFVLEGAQKLLANKIPLYTEIWPEGLKKNNSLELLIDILEKNYQQFICVHEGESASPISVNDLRNYCNKYENGFFDAFMIKD